MAISFSLVSLQRGFRSPGYYSLQCYLPPAPAVLTVNLDHQCFVLIVKDSSATGSSGGRLLSLCHPKSGQKTCYLLVDGVLQELNWLKQSYKSWFLGNYVCEDGSIYAATPIDPVFIMLPIFEEARLKKGEDPGKFRQLDEIIFIDGYPGYQYILPLAENCMQVVCEVKEYILDEAIENASIGRIDDISLGRYKSVLEQSKIGSSKFFRLDDLKVIAWLYCKVCVLKQTLSVLDQNYAAQDEKDTLANAVSILGEYVKDEPWLKLLCKHLNLDLLKETGKAPCIEVFPSSLESNVGSSNLLQERRKSDRKTNRTGKETKMAKPETESRNIKEMFSRASRRGSRMPP
ncbi:Ribonuclease H2 subunit B [Citrus sinensis]|uniref:Ribonuclease H2 subunit B n=1 Tax=Citrus sinensis TaxID=2711 RepID=A0ACB8NBW9_CITSI|nr:Ribonuclease H2 subunit B [Citrus sinensis]